MQRRDPRGLSQYAPMASGTGTTLVRDAQWIDLKDGKQPRGVCGALYVRYIAIVTPPPESSFNRRYVAWCARIVRLLHMPNLGNRPRVME